MLKVNKIHQGDCLELMPNIPDKSIDAIICDLPYGTTNCSWDSVIPFDKLWAEYERVIKDNGAIVLFASQPFTAKLIASNLRLYKYNWYWIKNNATGFAFAKYQPLRQVEDICVFYKKRPTYNPQGLIKLDKPKYQKGRHKGNVYRGATLGKDHIVEYTNYPRNVLNIKNEVASHKGRLHPTQKPLELIEYLIKTYTNEGDTILDNCMGSGTTALAAIKNNRNYIGIEMDSKYVEVANKRLKEALEK